MMDKRDMMNRYIVPLFALVLISSFSFALCSARITIKNGNTWATDPMFDNASMTCDATCTSCSYGGVNTPNPYARIDYTELDSGNSGGWAGQDFWHNMGFIQLRNKSFLTYYKLSLYDTAESKSVNNSVITIYRNGTTDIVWQGKTIDNWEPPLASPDCDVDADEGGFSGGKAYFILDARDSFDINMQHPTYAATKVMLWNYDTDAYTTDAAQYDSYGTGTGKTSGAANTFWFLNNRISAATGVTFNMNSIGVSAYGQQDSAPLQPSEMTVTIKDSSLARGDICSGQVDQVGEFYCSVLTHNINISKKLALPYDVGFTASTKYATLTGTTGTPFTALTAPNYFRFGNAVDKQSQRPFKVIQKSELDRGNNTLVWLIFPPKASEFNFTFNDYIDPAFTFVGSVALDRKSLSAGGCSNLPSGTSWTANPSNCPNLAIPTQSLDWFLATYTVKAPDTAQYYTFPSNGNISSLLPP